jgi:pimeloyl-ACP methyl ester carboxylesterase
MLVRLRDSNAPSAGSVGWVPGVFKKPYLYPGVALLAVAGWAFATAWSPIAAGHRTYMVFYAASALLGLAAIGLAVRGAGLPTRHWRAAFGTTGLLIAVFVTWFVTPFGATDAALASLESDDLVTVTSFGTHITMTPVDSQRPTGLIFQPGARVDARAYAGVLRPLAEAGHPIVIVKQPLGLAFFAAGFAPSWTEDHPEIERWVVGGHSLGGVVAAQNAVDGNTIEDLVLWASFPASDISNSTIEATSIYGTNDGLATAADIEASRENLPESATFVPIEGAIHSHFAGYGLQPGDGDPDISAEEAQRRIAEATLAFLSG